MSLGIVNGTRLTYRDNSYFIFNNGLWTAFNRENTSYKLDLSDQKIVDAIYIDVINKKVIFPTINIPSSTFRQVLWLWRHL